MGAASHSHSQGPIRLNVRGPVLFIYLPPPQLRPEEDVLTNLFIQFNVIHHIITFMNRFERINIRVCL